MGWPAIRSHVLESSHTLGFWLTGSRFRWVATPRPMPCANNRPGSQSMPFPAPRLRRMGQGLRSLACQVHRHRERHSSSWRRGAGPAGSWLAAVRLASREGWRGFRCACVSWQAVSPTGQCNKLLLGCCAVGVHSRLRRRYQTAGTQV